jgi:uncharacterized protein YbbK (DUF523 family)
MKQPKVLISACLLGQTVRYDGGHKLVTHAVLRRWLDEDRVISVCPELEGGLSVPRPAAEIAPLGSASTVWLRQSKIITADGVDATQAFLFGAEKAAQLAREHHIQVAVLKDGSPSCGSSQVYDGNFKGRRIAGMGVTAALLRKLGVMVFSETEFEQADICLLNPIR